MALKIKSFKTRIFLNFGIVIALGAILLIALIYLTQILNNYRDYRTEVGQLQTHVYNIKNQSNFIIEADAKEESFFQGDTTAHLKKFILGANMMSDDLVRLIQNPISERNNLNGHFTSINKQFELLVADIQDLISVLKQKGYKDYGKVGELRNKIHAVEEIVEKDEYKVMLLMLRRHEKDYLLRGSQKYIDKFKQQVKVFTEVLSGDDSQNSIEIKNALVNYEKLFLEMADLNSKIGNNSQEGIRLEIEENASAVLDKLGVLNQEVVQLESNKKSQLTYMIWGFCLIQILVGIIFSRRIASSITSRVKKILNNVAVLSKGEFPTHIETDRDDELAQITVAINDLTDRIKYASNYAREIGNGKLDLEYNEAYANDALANSIVEMQNRIKDTAEKDKLNAWKTEGLAKFGNLLQENKDEIEKLGFTIISELVKYLNAKVGALYVVSEDENDSNHKYLDIAGAYAYDREKFLEIRIEKGDGLVGQCWIEQERILLTEIPSEYLTITSGLGDAQPNCILLVPLIYNEEVYGVIEMATFETFTDYQIEFIEELGASIASTLSSTKVTQRTRKLLSASQQMQEEMQQQEEEMRQNLEEVQASQEMYEQKEQELLKEINRLKKKAGEA